MQSQKPCKTLTYKDFGIDLPIDAVGQHYKICPRCSESRKKSKVKCLGIDADRQIWHCNHCEWSGSLNQEERKKPYLKLNPLRDDQIPTEKLPDDIVKYFSDRGISKQTLDAYDVRYDQSTYFPQINSKVGGICFLYKKNGNIVNIKFRSINKDFKQIKNALSILFGMEMVPDYTTDFVIIVEGEIDALSCYEAGFKFVVSVPNGAHSIRSKNFESKFKFLKTCEEFLNGFDRFIIAVDNDEPGKKFGIQLAQRLGLNQCYSVTYPEGCKDANDVLVKFGEEGINRLIGSAKLFDKQLLEDNDLQEKREFPGHYIEDIISDNAPPPPFIIDKILPEKSILLISAPPKSFKTMFSFNLAISFVSGKSLHDFKISKPFSVFYCQAEMAYFVTRDQRLKPMMQYMSTVPRNRLFVTDRVTFNVLDDKKFEKLTKLLQYYDVAIFDPFVSFHNADENKNDQMQRVMERFRLLTTLCNVSVILVHHSRKAFDGYGGNNARGASAIFGAVDSFIELKKIDKSTVQIHFDMRYGAPIENVTYKLNPLTLWLGKLATTNTATDRNDKICSFVQESGGSIANVNLKKKIETEFKVSNNTATSWVKNIINAGRLTSDGKNRNPIISLP